MTPYLALFAVPLWFAFALRQSQSLENVSRQWQWKALVVALLLMIGLRHEVGGDWTTYVEHVEAAQDMSWTGALNLDGSLY